jgi:hypothetical protein
LAIVLGLLGSSARADLILQAGLNGGPLTTLADVTGSPTTPGGVTGSVASATVGSYTITTYSGSETQTSSLTQLLSSTLRIVNTGTSSGTLNLVITGTAFTSPTGTVRVSSSLGGSAGPISGTSDTVTYTTQVPAGTSIGTASATLGTTSGTEAYTAVPTLNTTVGGLTAPYSLAQLVNISLTGSGDTAQFTATTNLTAIPEPSTMALACLGALGFIGYSLRRRKAQDA